MICYAGIICEQNLMLCYEFDHLLGIGYSDSIFYPNQSGSNQMYQVGNKLQKNVFGALFLLPCYFIVLKRMK